MYSSTRKIGSMRFMPFLLATLLVCCTYPVAQAQDTVPSLTEEALYPGCIISPENDTVSGYLFYKSLLHNQTQAIFYDSVSGSQHVRTFRPDEINGYILSGMLYHSVPFSGRYSARKTTFMHCLVEGSVSLYKWYFHEKQQYFESNAIWDYTSSYDPSFQTQLFVHRKGEKPLELSAYRSPHRFHVRLSTYLKDDPGLAEKIRSKTPGFRFEDLHSIIRDYNDGYQVSGIR